MFIPVIFFLSGMPALIYQLTWQRTLFTIYGINIEAVAIVVAGFLLGLGLGSLVAGRLSAKLASRPPLVLLYVFAGIEFSVGLLGFVSLSLLSWVGARTLSLPLPATAAITLGLLVLPTMLMGATLPILVAYLVRTVGNVGQSVGLLYFTNTLGSAFACFLAAVWLMRIAGMHGAVRAASLVNFTVAAGALIFARYAWRRTPAGANPDVASGPAQSRPRTRRFAIAWVLAAMTGYLSLSYEIVWFRGYSTGYATASAFALVLSAFLAGVAIGSFFASRHCARIRVSGHGLTSGIAILLTIIAALGFILLPLAGWAATIGLYATAMLSLIMLHSALSGAVFPLVAHYGVEADALAGKGLGELYFGNIVGSVAGSLVTGFVLFDYLSLAQIVGLLAVVGLVLALTVSAPELRRYPVALLTGSALSVGLLVFAGPGMFAHIYEHIIYKTKPVVPFVATVENKHGVINVSQDKVVFGGALYDGINDIDLLDDRGGLIRPLLLSYFDPKPGTVLMIGLATGAWGQILANHPDVEKLTVVEINDGYLQLIAKTPLMQSLLSNPKVEIIIDDGRRWLNRHPDRKFDAIVSNTTEYFRANTTNLLSLEFLELIANHLNPGGIYLYNTTNSLRSQRTGCGFFKYGQRIEGSLYLSQSPLAVSDERFARVLQTYRIDGRPLIDPEKHPARWAEMIGEPHSSDAVSCAGLIARTGNLAPYTDDNMGGEWDQILPNDLVMN